MELNSSLVNNEILCRNNLEIIEQSGINNHFSFESISNLEWLNVKGYMGFGEDGNINYRNAFKNMLSSLNISLLNFSFVIKGSKKGLEFYFGTVREKIEFLRSSLLAYVPGIDIRESYEYGDLNLPINNSAVFLGTPSDILSEDIYDYYQMDNLCRGMLAREFAYVVYACRLPGTRTVLAKKELIKQMNHCSENIQKTIGNLGNAGNITKQYTDFSYKEYLENLEEFRRIIDEGMNSGLWRYSGFLLSNNEDTLTQLMGITKSNFNSRKEYSLQPIRCIKLNNSAGLLSNPIRITEPIENKEEYPFSSFISNGVSFGFDEYQYQSIVDSESLSVICRLPLHEFPGVYVDDYVLFDNSMRYEIQNKLNLGKIINSGRNTSNDFVDNYYSVDYKDLSRHALIIGATGGGKTNTTKSILKSLWCQYDIPFLVIESAKREYWDLYNIDTGYSRSSFDDLTVYTLGSETKDKSIKYRINPFEVAKGASIQTHIDSLLSTFQAAFELYPPMPYVLETSIYEVYQDRGWDIVENYNIYGLNDYPTLTNLYYKIDEVTDRLGYDKEVQSNVKAALKARINSLRIGGKGAMLDTPYSIPIQSLLSKPTVLELEDLGDDETKSFVIGILMVQLYEYRKYLLSGISKEFDHLLVIEEAHRLLSANNGISSTGNNSKQKAVEYFCNMLAEIRTFGQGIMIADQVPTKLASDAIKNTNLKLVHRTVMRDDREEIGNAMNMSEEQIGYLSSLQRGVAAVYAEGDNKPKLVKMPLVKNKIESLSRKDVLDAIRKKIEEDSSIFVEKHKHFATCDFCEKRCQFKEQVKKDIGNTDEIKMLFEDYKKNLSTDSFYKMINKICEQNNLQYNNHQKYCMAGQLLKILKINNQQILASKLIKTIFEGDNNE